MVIADTGDKFFAPDVGGYTHYNHEEERQCSLLQMLFS